MTDIQTPRGEPLSQLTFDNRLLQQLPADPQRDNYPRQVQGAIYSYVNPQRAPAPQLVAYAREVADLLDLTPEDCSSERFAQVVTGNALLPGMEPHATCYGGHQFGQWAGQLGDGRAINLGEVKNRRGEHWTLQLKGAGPTPYSRSADGNAVLRSSLREFLCSEAMHHLGVPTTRALSLTLTGDQVQRDMFYDGNPRWEPGAVVCRVAPSFTRFGHFELLTARGDTELLRQMADFTLRNDFPELGPPGRDSYIALLEEVCRRTARMAAHWMRVGFVHGVMNTDNMSILGLTIDYGPYGWLEGYDPGWTPNTTDAQGRRYRFGHQPQMALWNLLQLANALYPLVEEAAPLEAALEGYRREYLHCYQRDSVAKLGLPEYRPDTDETLTADLQQLLPLVETDMTIFYRCLADFDPLADRAEDSRSDAQLIEPLLPAYYQPPTEEHQQRTAQWLRQYRERLVQEWVRSGLDQRQRRERMNRVNPKYVLRNYMAQQAIDAAEQGDFTEVHRLLELLRHPYQEQPQYEHYFARRPEWARQRPGSSMLSCSS